MSRKKQQRAEEAYDYDAEEEALLQKINRGLPEEIWQEYHTLIARRRTETLTPEEQARLIALSDRIEAAHVERVTSVAELARRRNMPLKTLIKQLGVKPRKVPNAPSRHP